MEAVIFDMDGVICDTEPFHGRIEHQMFLQYGIDISAEEMVRRFAGGSFTEQVRTLFSERDLPIPNMDDFYERKTQLLIDMLHDDLPEIPGTRDLIIALHEQAVPLGLASGSPLVFIEFVLQTLDLKAYFTSVTSADEVARGKPAPDVFLLAAKRLGVDPLRCVVIEDAVRGMQAAKNAGMKCIGYVKNPTGDEPADHIVSDIEELSAHSILQLLDKAKS